MSSMMRYDSNKDGKLTANELKSAITKLHNSEKALIKDIVDKSTNSKSLTTEDKINLTDLIVKSHSLEPSAIIFNKTSIQKERQAINLKSHNENAAIFSGKTSKYVGLSEEATTQKYLSVMSKFKIHNIQPMSAPLMELRKYAAGSGSPRSSSDLNYLYMSKLTEAKQSNGKSINDNFRDKINNSKKENLDISDVLGNALEVTKGDYGLAVATVSNVFKSAAYEMRDLKNLSNGKNSFFSKEFAGNSEDFEKDIKMISKLGNLRVNNSNDKMGMWYHFFNVQSMSSYYGERKTGVGIDLEHGFRYIKPLFEVENIVFGGNNAKSPIDKEKSSVDNLSLSTFKKLSQKYIKK